MKSRVVIISVKTSLAFEFFFYYFTYATISSESLKKLILIPREAVNLELNQFPIKMCRVSKIAGDFRPFFIFTITIPKKHSDTERGIRNSSWFAS